MQRRQENNLCRLSEKVTTEEDYLAMLDDVYQERLSKLRNLMSGTTNDGYFYPNLDFINDFSLLFGEGVECYCKIDPESRPYYVKKYLSRGKIGTASILGLNRLQYVIKEISNVPRPEFLSLRIRDLSTFEPSHLEASPSIMANSVLTEGRSRSLICAVGDNFSNQTCIHMILNEVLGENPNYIYQYDAFYCQKDGKYSGNNITELADKGSLSEYLDDTEITWELLIDILRQVFEPFLVLKGARHGFVHADLKCRNVFVREEDGKDYFQLADFDKSSIFWNGIRFCNGSSTLARALPYISGFKGYTVREDLYHLGDYSSSFVENTGYLGKAVGFLGTAARSVVGDPYKFLDVSLVMHSQIPMLMSYDLYTFIYSLLREPKVYAFVFGENSADPQNRARDLFLRIMRSFWIPEDMDKVSENLRKDYEKYLDLSRNYELLRDRFQIIIQEPLSIIDGYVIVEDEDPENDDFEALDKEVKKAVSTSILEMSKKYPKAPKDLIQSMVGAYSDLQQYIVNLRSISKIGLALREYSLRTDLRQVYLLLFGEVPNERMFAERPRIKLTTANSLEEYHVCTSKCERGSCRTNKYSGLGWTGGRTTYTEHTC